MAWAPASAGHRAELLLIERHDHWFYHIGPRLADGAWAFMVAA